MSSHNCRILRWESNTRKDSLYIETEPKFLRQNIDLVSSTMGGLSRGGVETDEKTDPLHLNHICHGNFSDVECILFIRHNDDDSLRAIFSKPCYQMNITNVSPPTTTRQSPWLMWTEELLKVPPEKFRAYYHYDMKM